ncbi:hypothetical protein LX36DRAFT_561883, partial [Colletotrichum falcatum]
PQALLGGWGRRNIKRYEGLSRAQSTILLHCRTGLIGLNACLHSLNASSTYRC